MGLSRVRTFFTERFTTRVYFGGISMSRDWKCLPTIKKSMNCVDQERFINIEMHNVACVSPAVQRECASSASTGASDFSVQVPSPDVITYKGGASVARRRSVGCIRIVWV